MNSRPRPTQTDWAARYPALTLQSGELKGACPSCGGTDRFRVLQDGRFYCRGCCPDGKHGEAFKRILSAAFPERSNPERSNAPVSRPAPNRSIHPTTTARAPERPTHARAAATGEESKRIARARRQWYQAQRLPERPSEYPEPLKAWLHARHLAPPDFALPDNFRWQDAGGLGGVVVVGLWPLAQTVAAWPARPAARPCAVHLIAIDGQGGKRDAWKTEGGKLNKKSLGVMPVFALGAEPRPERIHITEGIADVLAIYTRRAGAVLSLITTPQTLLARPGAADYILAAGCGVEIWPDMDPQGTGQARALELAQQLAAQRVPHYVHQDAQVGDPAEWAAQNPHQVDRADFDTASGKQLNDGVPLHVADRLALLAHLNRPDKQEKEPRNG